VATLKANYVTWLTETGQEEKAAELKERYTYYGYTCYTYYGYTYQ